MANNGKNTDLPVLISVSDNQNVLLQWSLNAKILLVLQGTMHVQIDEQAYEMSDGDIILINQKTLHEYSCSDCIHVICQFDFDILDNFKQGSRLQFLVNSVEFPDPVKYEPLRQLVSRLVLSQDQNGSEYLTLSLAYALLDELAKHFSVSNISPDTETKNTYSKHTKNVLNYILDHYRENLTLRSVAEEMYLSIPYLSSLFKKEMGVTFTTYYNDIRMNAAVYELLSSDSLIDDIAKNNGFQDSRTFLRLFKRKYGTLPSVYRKKHKVQQLPTRSSSVGLFYPSIGKSVYQPLLMAYLDKMSTDHADIITRDEIRCDTIDCSKNGITLNHTFKRVCSISSAKALLFDDVKNILRKIQSTIHYEYISFNGLLNIDPYLYSEKSDGTPVFTFVLIDKVIDFLISIDLKPIINFSYMPLLLCRDIPANDGNYLFRSTPPKDYDTWATLIHSLVTHLVDRYGEDVVASWPFNVWRKPDVKLFSIGDREFLKLYEITYNVVKKISAKFMFGTPALAFNTNEIRSWDSMFFDYIEKKSLRPDFLCFTYYNDVFDEDSSQTMYMKHKSILNKDPDAYSVFLDSVEAFVKERGLDGLPLHMLQWNLTVSHRNLINDTCFPACYIAKNLLENYDRTASFCYWCASDYSEELELPDELFFGGPGMFTHNGLRKPQFYVFQFISKMGDELIGHGKGWFVTRNPVSQKISIIFYNYVQYSDSFADGNYYDLTPTNRYSAFDSGRTVDFSLKLEGLDTDHCFIREFFVNRENGSCLDKWIEMGALTPREDELNMLNITEPGLFLHKEKINNGILHIESELQPLEVRLIEILPHK